jgi:hypothetical protein
MYYNTSLSPTQSNKIKDAPYLNLAAESGIYV